MNHHADAFAARLRSNRLSRRDALWLFGASTAAVAGLQGCATSPVTGKSILVGLSEEQERAIDAQQAPHQFSADLGPVQDAGLNEYVADVGRQLHQNSHRPQMPYSYRVLNANYVNAYTFPAGAVGVTRGIMTELDDEAQLAALLGHELGHVNARHSAQRQGQAMVAQAVVAGIGVAASNSQWGALAGLGSQIGASALLASYSRDNEREADALGQEYMVRCGYPASGMTALHQMLVEQEKEQPSLLATMFSSHPMSTERRDTAKRLAETRYATSLKAPAQRERYMDHTAGLRRIKPTIDACKNGETAMARKAYQEAQNQFATAIKRTPQDYAANLRMAQCLQAQGHTKEAQRYVETAKTIYPQEAQARKLSGVLALSAKDPARAYAELDAFDRMLPGDPGVTFLKGISAEGMGDRLRAAQHYNAYLRATRSGEAAQYSASRLKAWGYLK
ncbi:M48 family metalloprotease [Caldimonas thermodepolymerans]|jgi:Putative Zn-dependent protease, contains TPR repeats|uniref:Peptidase M48 n=1 Tax=Caldimonas thermodepolymerans TaxID=215580 RepID=A0A2S5T0S3_9BURK|nr:M48 family metalloprotease [Caldimonas thermodepolymerans]PPE68556.1 peptidase M48 [Caldimonas thermodepolymerans]QPC30861.1 M48 family metalloprotease [Caldimonas thermodepolymerans]RDH97140.1 putative Zn-dependent protease [Caldimonas thermodepolymerans]TCP08958.1 putative Zn-dependent protease [Caldimonas thermodepolymerans]UZG43598.1 M48 family metalloprotease [Caldimonas thermodepolymerans]